MTTVQKILLVAGGALGFLWLASRSSSASAGESRGVVYPPSPPGSNREPEPVEVQVQDPPPGPPAVTVFFDTGSSTVNQTAVLELNMAAFRQPAAAELHGYASTRGNAASNLALTERRTASVAALLRAKLPNVTIASYAHGEQGGLADSDPRSRRVDVYLS